MNFSIVDYTQKTYRSLLDSMARPGKMNKIENIELSNNGKFSNYALEIAQTLLDQEVEFCVLNGDKETEKNIKVLTMGRLSNINEADYLFVSSYGKIDFNKLRKGNLAYPDESTTIIHEIEEMNTEKIKRSIKLKISGPGVKDKSWIYIRGLETEIVDRWMDCNREYPLGVDIIFVDKMGKVCCIPRSSKLEWEVI